MKDVYIAAALRTPVGRLNGRLRKHAASELGATVLKCLVEEAGLAPDAVDEVIMGQVLTGGAGQNPARQAAVKAGLPVTVPAMGLNKVCGAGMKSMHLAAQAIKCGDADLVLAGGQDSMTQAPFAIHGMREGHRMGSVKTTDTMVSDGLWDAFHDVHMGVTVEGLARRYQITREAQDAFALASQRKAAEALAADRFREQIRTVSSTDGKSADTTADEQPNAATSMETLARLRPVFDPEGTITAGNASSINDGAAAVIIGSGEALDRHGLSPLVRIASYASAAVEPMDMGLGPVDASRKALAKAGWTVDDLDVMEINEAFAAQAIAVNTEMGWDPDRINLSGGAIALGHPLAGSGARIVVALVHEMSRTNARRGLASLCIGGGQGVAICLER
ncbi:MAG: acetyl-CoA C-acetyltransferase [Bauldia sp.]|uniref:acetyl-CoA C-acetyltransferase n=1 Tax=Bauldia sp. TaxID=2575872 RepID=UPI001DA3EBA0|nr:acetyl-CoA C-acetyltransferase [Bauldia sp.]MCB1494337.1 acetyl-CoA C-acetyltransferase [Bauldia sp.]